LGCGGSVNIALTSKSILPTQQFRDRLRQPLQSPERGQDKRLCIKKTSGLEASLLNVLLLLVLEIKVRNRILLLHSVSLNVRMQYRDMFEGSPPIE
jgi:hypothetical protein